MRTKMRLCFGKNKVCLIQDSFKLLFSDWNARDLSFTDSLHTWQGSHLITVIHNLTGEIVVNFHTFLPIIGS